MDRVALGDRQRHKVGDHESKAVQIHVHNNRRCLHVPRVPGSVKNPHNNNKGNFLLLMKIAIVIVPVSFNCQICLYKCCKFSGFQVLLRIKVR